MPRLSREKTRKGDDFWAVIGDDGRVVAHYFSREMAVHAIEIFTAIQKGSKNLKMPLGNDTSLPKYDEHILEADYPEIYRFWKHWCKDNRLVNEDGPLGFLAGITSDGEMATVLLNRARLGLPMPFRYDPITNRYVGENQRLKAIRSRRLRTAE